MYPNLFTIGAAKSGTSSLHYYLSLHPEIHMSREKEPHYFTRLAGDDRPGLPTYSDARYQALFESDLPVRGESSVTYSFWPYPSGIPALIRAAAPDARFIYLVRDPVERTIAHFNHRVVLGTEDRSLSEVIAHPTERKERYICGSSYATQLERYQEHFPEDRFLVIDHDDLLHARNAVLEEIFAFLGVDEAFRDPRFEAVVHKGEDSRIFSPLGRTVRFSAPYRAATRWIRPDVRLKLIRPLRAALSEPVQRVTPTQPERAVLADKLAGEAARLRALTGKTFASWSV